MEPAAFLLRQDFKQTRQGWTAQREMWYDPQSNEKETD